MTPFMGAVFFSTIRLCVFTDTACWLVFEQWQRIWNILLYPHTRESLLVMPPESQPAEGALSEE